ncbi:MAG: hypothetical protein ACJ74U_13890 [Jatrophihabitantaceae bacterium]
MEYWLLFWGAAAGKFADASDAWIAARLRSGQWQCVQACPGVAGFRRDLLASDPDWTAMRLLPRPGGETDRYLAVVFTTQPSEDEVRDLRYVAARNRLRMFDPQTG